MIIFDQFPDQEHANKFAAHVRDTLGRTSFVYDSQVESNKHDPFPFQLQPPIVLVERAATPEKESEITALVENFQGAFAGT